jgi:hypothetical protein
MGGLFVLGVIFVGWLYFKITEDDKKGKIKTYKDSKMEM